MSRKVHIVPVVIGILIICGLVYLGYARFVKAAGGSGPAATINLGDVYTVELEENASTGYSWAVEYDQSKLQLVKDEAVPPAAPIPGAPGKHVWEFKAIARGRTTIRFSYARAWESKPPEKVEEYAVRIR